jgi:hypothetical protein
MYTTTKSFSASNSKVLMIPMGRGSVNQWEITTENACCSEAWLKCERGEDGVALRCGQRRGSHVEFGHIHASERPVVEA